MKLNKLHAISLLELMITIAIVIILMAISFNSISSLQVENQRKEATSELIKLKSNIEQLALSGYVDSTPVRSIMQVAHTLYTNKQIFPSLKYYTISISFTPSTATFDTCCSSYTLTATATEPLATQDTTCKIIDLTVNTDNTETKPKPECW